MDGAEHLLCGCGPISVRTRLTLLLCAALAATAPAQTNPPATMDWGDLLGAVQEWAEENLDEDVLALLSEPDERQVREFFRQFEQHLGGGDVLELAALRQAARSVMPLLEAHEETRPYAAWLRARLDYLDAAEELRRAMPTPPTVPGRPPPPRTNPPPSLERQVWSRRLAQRPLPPGAETLVPQLKAVFRRERVPPELVWLAEVESGFDRRARSPAGAAGLFQLMPATAQRYGLRRWPFDQRYQVEPSARAAAQHLRHLHARFKDWALTLAAYNAGEGRVGGLVTRLKARSFDALTPHLPAETQLYVPRVEATLLRREGVPLRKLPAPGNG